MRGTAGAPHAPQADQRARVAIAHSLESVALQRDATMQHQIFAVAGNSSRDVRVTAGMKRRDPEKPDREPPTAKPVRVVCPKTSAPFTVRLKNDTDWLAKHWHNAMKVRCPRCRSEHAYIIKDVYLSEAIADDQPTPNLFAA
jgi:hypothetical protein